MTKKLLYDFNLKKKSTLKKWRWWIPWLNTEFCYVSTQVWDFSSQWYRKKRNKSFFFSITPPHKNSVLHWNCDMKSWILVNASCSKRLNKKRVSWKSVIIMVDYSNIKSFHRDDNKIWISKFQLFVYILWQFKVSIRPKYIL